MGILLDVVPNHMGVGPENPFWDDVLAHGQASRYADWFDVAWRATPERLAGKVLVPVLGEPLSHVLARDEITLVNGPSGVRVQYFDHSFPLDPATAPKDTSTLSEWGRGAEGRRRLRRLLARQHYVLAFWRTARRDLNYRRFFDVNELISLRVEREDVFLATHKRVLQFVAGGVIDALRVDHVDGLLEPRQYLQRLRQAVGGDVPILVEKILAHDESLPDDWPVEGTTGYEFLVALEDVFIDPAGAKEIERRYRGRGTRRGFARVSVNCKRRVLRNSLNADVRRIAPMLAALADRAGWIHCSIAAYATAIVEFIAELPVYRTYIDSGTGVASARDESLLSTAIGRVRERSEANDAALAALERALLSDWTAAGAQLARLRLQFVLRLQQLSGPAAAKGVEDTALYAYAPLTSRCEVGGDPAIRVDGALERFGRTGNRACKAFPEIAQRNEYARHQAQRRCARPHRCAQRTPRRVGGRTRSLARGAPRHRAARR